MLVVEWTICFGQSRVLLGVSTPSCSMQVIVGSIFHLQCRFLFQFLTILKATLCRTPVGYPLTMWCGGVAWYGWIPLDPDRIMSPGWGPTGWGWVTPALVVTPAVEATAQPNALRLNLNSDAVSRPIEKECPWDSTMF